VIPQSGLAVLEVAPDWAEYMERRTWPLVKVLGRYPINWKRKFADLTFSQNPDELDGKRKTLYEPLAAVAYSGKGPDDQRHPSESRIVSAELDRKFRTAAKTCDIKKGQVLPPQVLNGEFPGVRHVKVSKNKGGTFARIEPKDGPPRKVELKPASEAIVFWTEKGESIKELKWSIQYPKMFQPFGVFRFQPSMPDDAVIVETWPRHNFIWLDEGLGYKAGYYRVKEFDEGEVRLLSERDIPDALARRLNIKRQVAPDGSNEGKREIKLRKPALIKYFETLNGGKHHDPGTGS
jgi:hypothetical protein